MAVETAGFVTLSGDNGPGVAVGVIVDEGRIRLVSDGEQLADWVIDDLGIRALQDGFIIRASGEEYHLRTKDDALLAEELGVVAASPRLAKMVAARHRPEERPDPEPQEADEPVERPKVGPLALALGGVLVISGGFFLRLDNATEGDQAADLIYQWPLMVGGAVMVAASLTLLLRVPYSRLVAGAVLAVMVVVLGFALGDVEVDGLHLVALGLTAGGVVIGVSVLAWGEGPANST